MDTFFEDLEKEPLPSAGNIELRDYQKEVIDKILWAKRKGLEGNDLVVLPTGAGKSIVIANIAHQLNEPILILQPSKEILEQNYEKLSRYVDKKEIGIYSASAGRKDVGYYTFATIQSIYTKPEHFKQFKLVIVDECHLINPKNLSGMFSSFLAAIGNPKVIGLTATPYRMDTMYVNEGDNSYRVTGTIKLINRMKGFFWQRVLFNINIGDLIEKKFLCPLEYMDRSVIAHEDIPINNAGTDFDLDAFVERTTNKKGEIKEAIAYAQKISKSVLVFCSSVSQAESLAQDTEGAEVVTGKTPAKERARIINDFKNGRTKIVFNMGVLTTGFDHPSLDCIILARPTRSIALYYQILGRGVRIAEGKTSCKVIDLTSTVKNLGRVETIKLVKREKWELESEAGSWHNQELFSYRYEKKKTEAQSAKEAFYSSFK